MEQFNRDHGTHFVAVTKVFIAPLGIYAGRTKTLAAAPDKTIIAIPRVGHEGGMLDQTLHAAQALGQREQVAGL